MQKKKKCNVVRILPVQVTDADICELLWRKCSEMSDFLKEPESW